MDKRLSQIRAELMEVTTGCSQDMHEPDGQGLKCRVVGDHLDNACGNDINLDAITRGYQEFVVCFERFQEAGSDWKEGEPKGKFVLAQINLADLIALARYSEAATERR